MPQAIETLLKPAVQELLDSFSACFGVRIGYFTNEGEELNVGLQRGPSSFCELIRERLYSGDTCRAFDRARLKEAMAKKGLHHYTCYAGATEAIYPVIIEGSPIGYFMIGQFRCRQTPAAQVLNDWKNLLPSSSELNNAFLDLPNFTEDQAVHVFKLFSALVSYIISANMVSLRGNLVVESALGYMKSRIHDHVTLDEVAKLVGRSPSTVSHLFKSVTGRSFKETLIRMKLDHADALFSADPQITVAEVATAISYNDPFYFSRIYKKYRGVPPSYASRR